MERKLHVLSDGRGLLWIVVFYGLIISSLLVAIAGTLILYGVLTIAQWVQFLYVQLISFVT